MNSWFYIASGITCIYLLVYIIYSSAIIFNGRVTQPDRKRKISILIAARNEEANISACLESVAQMNYPEDLMEVHIGDDRSEDRTAELIRQFTAEHPNFHYHFIGTDLPGQRGKQNVLAQLAHHCKGEIILVTDADILVNENWAASLCGAINEKTAMVSGPTLVAGSGAFTKMQTLDWMMGIGAATAHDRLDIPITAVGNNMAFTRKAYLEAGGYENIEFSITEDYKLFQVLCEKNKNGYSQLLNPEALNLSAPVFTVRGWLQQRRRWFRGGAEIAWYNRALLLFNSTVVPVLIASFFLVPLELWFWLPLAKSAADFVFLSVVAWKLGKMKWLLWFPPYELYYILAAIVTPLNYLAPAKVNWKGRKY